MRLTHRPIALTLSEPFTTRKETKPSVTNVLVEIAWNDLVGVGVAVPAREQGTTPESIARALDVIAPTLEGATPFDADVSGKGHPAAISAVDMALHDLIGKARGFPIHRLLGCDGPLPSTATTIGVMSPREAEKKARELSRWPILKVKASGKDDIEVVRAVRGVYGGRLCVDGNGAYGAAEAVAVANALAREGVEVFEQPVARGDVAGLRLVRSCADILVFADEDCSGPEDIPRLAGAVDGVNVKLLKCGGIRGAMRTIALARAHRMSVMLGCKVESTVGVTAMAHLAGLADYLDLDGHLDLVDDPYEGVAVDHGAITLPEGPGLGLRPARTSS
jgi:L-alanine-DL-glutamate epimerase-like enolase superfamily enzyme